MVLPVVVSNTMGFAWIKSKRKTIYFEKINRKTFCSMKNSCDSFVLRHLNQRKPREKIEKHK